MNAAQQRAETNASAEPAERRPVLIVPYMWIGDFVRCHTVVQVLKSRWPQRPVDILATPLTAPLADYMPGVRKAVLSDLPRGRLAFARQRRLAARLAEECYGSALVMPRTWKAALAPWLAGIPERTGYVGEARFVLLNDARWRERALPRMVDRCAALALPPNAPLPAAWPAPRLIVPHAEIAGWRSRRGLDERRPAIALAPGAVGPSKRWPAERYAGLARELGRQNFSVWVLGGPGEKDMAQEIAAGSHGVARDLTGADLRDAVLALAAADAAVSNDSGLLHVAAAIGTPSIGIFGPTSPWHWAPLNPLAATIETTAEVSCRPCHKPVCRLGHHQCMHNIPVEQVVTAVQTAVGRVEPALAH
ncbi:MAG TPA: lipopolysaccharide heptosyltransferase II [Xanthobacteraceae bacterium]|nr:lipopolysaccharide heptosyltransferase II [Xanthobacteraceae bacterium]